MRRKIDPSLLEGEDLVRWYRRSSDQIEAERRSSWEDGYRTFLNSADSRGSVVANDDEAVGSPTSDQGQGWREARMTVLPTAAIPAPSGIRAAIPPAAGSVPISTTPGGFFRTYSPLDHPTLGPIYITDLPSPLNTVTPKVGDWFQLGDGSLVKGIDEVERLHDEQQKRIRGEDEVQPPAHVRTADRLKDGVIPQVSQIAKGQREKDATCHPNGGWERDTGFATNSERSRRYETQIGRAPGLDYVVRNPGERPVNFDGCAVWDPRHQLLEAKGLGYQSLLRGVERIPNMRTPDKLRDQMRRQAGAARGKVVEWHFAEPGAVPTASAIAAPYRSIRVLNTPIK